MCCDTSTVAFCSDVWPPSRRAEEGSHRPWKSSAPAARQTKHGGAIKETRRRTCRWRCADKVLVTSPRGKYLSGDWSDTWQRARQEKKTNFGWEWDVFFFCLSAVGHRKIRGSTISSYKANKTPHFQIFFSFFCASHLAFGWEKKNFFLWAYVF